MIIESEIFRRRSVFKFAIGGQWGRIDVREGCLLGSTVNDPTNTHARHRGLTDGVVSSPELLIFS